VSLPVANQEIEVMRSVALRRRCSLTRRAVLLHWAAAEDAHVLEDDYDGDYRYEGRPITSLQDMDCDRVGGLMFGYAGASREVTSECLKAVHCAITDTMKQRRAN
jgi:GntR family transcriptional regulator / MocR family aminotransferase